MKVKDIEKEWLNMEEACKYTGLTRRSIMKLQYRGKLTFYRPARYCLYKKEDLDNLIEAGLVEITNVDNVSIGL